MPYVARKWTVCFFGAVAISPMVTCSLDLFRRCIVFELFLLAEIFLVLSLLSFSKSQLFPRY